MDHSRIRGVHHSLLPDPGPLWGSFPHTRGTPAAATFPAVFLRLIPAYAGSTYPSTMTSERYQDHSRIRGVHFCHALPPYKISGSFPHTRGTLDTIKSTDPDTRIIPAYAGYTRVGEMDCRSVQDHSRIRGVHQKAEGDQLHP